MSEMSRMHESPDDRDDRYIVRDKQVGNMRINVFYVEDEFLNPAVKNPTITFLIGKSGEDMTASIINKANEQYSSIYGATEDLDLSQSMDYLRQDHLVVFLIQRPNQTILAKGMSHLEEFSEHRDEGILTGAVIWNINDAFEKFSDRSGDFTEHAYRLMLAESENMICYNNGGMVGYSIKDASGKILASERPFLSVDRATDEAISRAKFIDGFEVRRKRESIALQAYQDKMERKNRNKGNKGFDV